MSSTPAHRRPIDRRSILAATATLAATPVLAETCPVGPPQHDKGPAVWMGLDQVELDAAYDQAFYAPLARQIGERRRANSDAIRRKLGPPTRHTYGPTAVEQLDVFKSDRAKAPVFVFIHGGAWLGGEAKNYADSAELFVNAGCHYAVLDFIAIKEAGGDLRVMADQVRRGVAWVYRNLDKIGGDPDRFFIGGHSSGGHLCGVALVTDWEKDHGLPTSFIRGALCMSGMYDMKGVRLSKRSSYVKFDDAMEAAMSTQRHMQMLRTPVVLTYGSFETPEFQRQSKDFAAAATAAGKKIELIEATGYNHFEMGESLGHPYGPNGRAALAMIKAAGG